MKVCQTTYHFIQFLLDNPASTSRQIHEYLFKSLYPDNPNISFKHIYTDTWNPAASTYTSFGIQTPTIPTNTFNSSRFSYLTSPYFSNMLVTGRRTKSRPWVTRFQDTTGLFRYNLTPLGLAASTKITY
jgi:hypothetical protein